MGSDPFLKTKGDLMTKNEARVSTALGTQENETIDEQKLTMLTMSDSIKRS